MNWRILVVVVYLLLGAVLWLLGTVIFRENPHSRVNRVTGLMLFFGGLGPMFAAVGTGLGVEATAATFERSPAYYNVFYLWELFFPQLLMFSLVFPVEHPLIGRFRRLKYAIFVPHIFHFVWVAYLARPDLGWMEISAESEPFQTIVAPINMMLGFFALGLALLFEFHLKFFSVIDLVYIAVAVWALWAGYKRLSNQRLREQVRVIIIGILSGVGLYSLAFIAPRLGIYDLPVGWRVGLTILALLVGSGAIAWAIIRYQFLDIRFIVRQSLVFTISSAMLLGGYLLLVSEASRFVKEFFEVDTPLIDIVFVVFVLLLFQPLKNRVDDLITRVFIRDKADPRAILESFSREIASVFDIEQLKQRMIASMINLLFVEKAFFATRSPSGGYILELAGMPREPFPADDRFFVDARLTARPATFEHFVVENANTPMTEVLTRWGCRLVVPIMDRGELTAVLLLGEKVSGYRYGPEDFQLLSTLANQLAVAFTNAILYQEALEKQKMEEELNVARQIQLQLLPRTTPSGDRFEVAAFSHPSRQVGGDYYDFFPHSDGSLGMVVADISGKGVGAALLVSQLQAILKAEVRARGSLETIITNTNALITESTAPDRFATLVYAEFHPDTLELNYCNAGHNYPLVVRADGTTETLETGGLLLGVSGQARYKTNKITLSPGDLVLFYTDGLSEINDPEGHEFGERRLTAFMKEHRHLPVDDLKNRLVREVSQFALGEIGFDDLTIVLLKIREKDGRT
ncbi:MAG: hypothetical protein Kow0074_21780 [Candidatus Zixiibacteriota bacterium]